MKLPPFFVALLFLFACGLPQQRDSATQNLSPADSLKVFQEKIEKTNLDIGSSVSIPNSEYVFFPLSANLEKKYRGRTNYNYSSYEKGKEYYGYPWNLMFYNLHTQQHHLLLDTGAAIIREYHSEPEPYSNPSTWLSPRPWLIYLITREDYNQNGILDYLDPSYLFSSDLAGKNFQQLSPSGLHVKSWKYLRSDSSLIEIAGLVDSNKDSLFDQRDREEIWHIRLAPEITQTQVVGKDLQDSLKQLFLERIKP